MYSILTDFAIITVLTAFWAGIELWAFLFFMQAFLPLKSKYGRKIHVLILLIAWLILSFYPNVINNKLLKMVLTFFVYFTLSALTFDGKLATISCLVALFYIFSAAIDIGSINGGRLLLGISYPEFVWRKRTYTSIVTIGKLLLAFVSWMVHRFQNIRNLKDVQWKYFLLMLLFPTISGIILTFLYYQSRENADLNFITVLVSGLLLLANIGIIYIINAIDKSAQQAKESELLKQQMKLQAENYEALHTAYALQRKSTHEFQRHIGALRNLMEQQEYAAAFDYIQHLEADRSLKIFSIHSNHPIVDVVLNQKYQLAQEHNIKMQIRINDLSGISIPANNLVVLLSNLLDNAIEACQKVSAAKQIDCTILLEQDLFISIRNTALPVEIIDNEIKSTKDNPLEHGYGLPAINLILKQLNAEYGFTYSTGWFQFAAEIPL